MITVIMARCISSISAPTPPAFAAPIGLIPSPLCHDRWILDRSSSRLSEVPGGGGNPAGTILQAHQRRQREEQGEHGIRVVNWVVSRSFPARFSWPSWLLALNSCDG